jgi:hypothetical protein
MNFMAIPLTALEATTTMIEKSHAHKTNGYLLTTVARGAASLKEKFKCGDRNRIRS